MKNLSFLISTFIAITMFLSCSNKNNNIKSENQSVVEKPLIDIDVSNIDTTKNKQNTVVIRETEIKQDTFNKNTKYSKYIVVEPVYNNLDLETIEFDPVAFFSDALIKKLK